MQKLKSPSTEVFINTLAVLFTIIISLYGLTKLDNAAWEVWMDDMFQCYVAEYWNFVPCSFAIFVNDVKQIAKVSSKRYETMIWGSIVMIVLIYQLLKYEVKK